MQTGNSRRSEHKNVFNKQLWIIRGHHVSVPVFSLSFWLLLPYVVCLTTDTLLVIKKSPAQSPVAMGLEGGPFSQEVEGREKRSQNEGNHIACAQSAIIRHLTNVLQ